jgi:hypothetical protein
MRMVSIRRNNNNNNGVGGHFTTSRVTLYAATAAVFILTAIYVLSNNSSSTSTTHINSAEEVSPHKVMMNTVKNTKSLSTDELLSNTENNFDRDEEGGNIMTITSGSVTYTVKPHLLHPENNNDTTQQNSSSNQQQEQQHTTTLLNYYHCGPLPTKSNPQLSELVLLHGAAFTKEDWKSSGILDMLCDINNNEDGGDLSITAWDLPVSADGYELIGAYNAMVNDNKLSGHPVTFVTPSASGKALTTLGTIVHEQDAHQELKLLVKGWIPVASGSVLKVSDEALLKYVHANIPILAIHGDQDIMGKKVTERLVQLTKAKGVELEGHHPVYLDSPDDFVMEIIKFMEENGL